MGRVDRFLSAFIEIEKYLERYNSQEYHQGFAKLIGNAINNRDPVINRYHVDLRQFAKLRNVIVHTERKDFVIAKPTEKTVQSIEQIAHLILDPPNLSLFKNNNIVWIDANSTVRIALEQMVPKNLSQAPIYNEEEFLGLLTTDTIARWLHEKISNDTLDQVNDEHVIHVYYKCTEIKDNYKFLSLQSSIFDAINLFDENEKEGKRLEAILLTEDGNTSVDIKGIMTTWDIPKALSLVDLSNGKTKI